MYRDQLRRRPRDDSSSSRRTGEYPFWMKNTLIPLDMIWIDASSRIAHIAHDVPPCKADPVPNYPPNAQAPVRAGGRRPVWRRKHGLEGRRRAAVRGDGERRRPVIRANEFNARPSDAYPNRVRGC